MFTESELKGKKLPELKEIGATLKVEKAKTLRKPDLIAGILKAICQMHSAEEKPAPTPSTSSILLLTESIKRSQSS